MKYKKKPVVIDAVQWTGKNHREMFDFLTQDTFKEESMQVSGDHFYIDHNKVKGGLIIKTLEGEHLATIGDYIIRGVKGEYYPCKEDIFHQTYELEESNQSEPYTLKYGDGSGTINVLPTSTLVPFHTICGCTTCSCTTGNRMVDPKYFRVPVSTSTTTHITSLSPEPEPNGVPCPICGEELMDSNPMLTLTSDPPQKNVHCSSCEYVGYRTI